MTIPLTGGVYYVADKTLTLPPNDERQYHDRRTVVVISGEETNRDTLWRPVLVVPTSSQTTYKTKYCVTLNHGMGNVQKKCWIRTSAVQPILKTELSDHLGVIPPEKLAELQARLFEYMGLVP
jgi:mRNA-degrading endonuclease toxin of MazEF toxin-antitoxin module